MPLAAPDAGPDRLDYGEGAEKGETSISILPKKLSRAFVAFALGLSSCSQASEFAAAELKADGGIVKSYGEGARPGAIYQAGSIAKHACTILALRMADRGDLSLDQSLRSLLPEVRLGAAGEPTLKQLLANRSGLRDGLSPAIEEDMAAVMRTSSAGRALALYAAGELAASPGAAFSYDLVNWIAVQAVLEKAGGAPIDRLLAADVLEPAGMADSTVFHRTLGDEAQEPVSAPAAMPDFLKCAGGLASEPAELIALVRFAHRGDLSPRSREVLTTITTPAENYTLGGRIERRGKRLIDWKTGSNGPYKSLVVYHPASDTGFAAMTGSDDWSRIEALREEWLDRTAVTGTSR